MDNEFLRTEWNNEFCYVFGAKNEGFSEYIFKNIIDEKLIHSLIMLRQNDGCVL